MQMNDALVLHRRALDDATAVVRDIGPADLARPSPCVGWDLRALLEHMVGQNHGFADALERAGRTDAPIDAFAPRSLNGSVGPLWDTSASRVAAAFTTASAVAPDAQILLAELSDVERAPVATLLAMHLLDTVVHTWDVATAVERPHRPDDELVGAVAEVAPMVPVGPARERPGASFAPVVAVEHGADAWTTTLAALGRSNTPAQRGNG